MNAASVPIAVPGTADASTSPLELSSTCTGALEAGAAPADAVESLVGTPLAAAALEQRLRRPALDGDNCAERFESSALTGAKRHGAYGHRREIAHFGVIRKLRTASPHLASSSAASARPATRPVGSRSTSTTTRGPSAASNAVQGGA